MAEVISEVIIILIIAAVIIVWIMTFKKKPSKLKTVARRCLVCQYSGEMKTWLGNYNLPQFVAFILLLAYVIPGLIFIGWGWGKYKCPNCGALAKNVPADFKPAA